MKHIYLTLALCLMGCPETKNNTTDTGTLTDTNTVGDTTATDTSTSTVTQAQCEAAIDAQITACASNTTSRCEYTALKAGCASDLNRKAVVDVLSCFTACDEIGDPSTMAITTCVRNAFAPHVSSISNSDRMQICTLCSSSLFEACISTDYEKTLIELLSSPTNQTKASQCLVGKDSCVGYTTCIAQNIPMWNSVFQCRM